ncbi:hypothetical protein RJT34_20861 [Clitoria ternatea]|uniref:Senescence-associated protein n=1 Tax=Clitoria ternatea TaxID=43366 RepID=A0AAN9P596_CLITE
MVSHTAHPPCEAHQRHAPLGARDPLLLVGKQTTDTCIASSPDSDLEAFSHNPTHGSFAPLAFQPSAMTNCANQRTKGSIGHAFTVRIRTGNQNQTSFYPFVPHEISVLVELILGHLRYLLTDVPPQPNSPPDNVFRPDRPTKVSLGSKKRGSAPPPIHRISPERPAPNPSPDRHAATRSRRESSSSSPPTADGFGTGTPVPSPQSQSFSRGYGSILPTSLAYIVPLARGCSPWRPDAVMSTTRRGRHSVLRIFKGRQGRTGHHATCGALPAAGPYLRLSRFQDLHRRPLRPGLRLGFCSNRRALLLIEAWYLPQRLGIDERFARQYRCGPPPEFPLASPRSGIVHHLSGPDSPGLGHRHNPHRSMSQADWRTGSHRSTSDQDTSPTPIRFPPDNFKHSLTLFSKSFSSFPRGTCSLSVSRPYLALDGIYHPIRAAFPNNPTRQQRLVVRQGPGTTGLSPSLAPPSRGLGPGPPLRTFLQTTIWRPKATNFHGASGVLKVTSADPWSASFMVETRTVSDRLRAPNFRS